MKPERLSEGAGPSKTSLARAPSTEVERVVLKNSGYGIELPEEEENVDFDDMEEEEDAVRVDGGDEEEGRIRAASSAAAATTLAERFWEQDEPGRRLLCEYPYDNVEVNRGSTPTSARRSTRRGARRAPPTRLDLPTSIARPMFPVSLSGLQHRVKAFAESIPKCAT